MLYPHTVSILCHGNNDALPAIVWDQALEITCFQDVSSVRRSPRRSPLDVLADESVYRMVDVSPSKDTNKEVLCRQ